MHKKHYLLFLIYFVCLTSCVYGQNRVINPHEVVVFTAPDKAETKSYLEFLAVGDTGTGSDGQKLVAKSMAEQAQRMPISFVLMLGDNFYELGVGSTQDAAWKERFEAMYDYPSLNYPFYAVLGNHDYLGNPQAQIDYTRVSPSQKWKMPSTYYTFKQDIDSSHQVEFFALDTEAIVRKTAEMNKQLQWLEAALSHSTATWKVVYGHHPIFSNGSHGNHAELNKLLTPMLEKYDVNIYLAGHDHDQQLLKPVNGVYYIVSGAGGKSRDVKWADNTLYAGTNFGFTYFRASQDELFVMFLNGKGQQEYGHLIQHD